MTTTHSVNSCWCFMCVIMPVCRATTSATDAPEPTHVRTLTTERRDPRVARPTTARAARSSDSGNDISRSTTRSTSRRRTAAWWSGTRTLLRPGAGDTILDAGAGTGNVTQVLAVPGARVIGIDFCAPALERCRRKVPTAEFRAGDLTRPLAFDTASFDKVACSLVLHYLTPDRQRSALAELFRVLKPGGSLAITVFASGFRTMRVYAETLRERRRDGRRRRNGRGRARYLINTIRIFYYVWRIKRSERAGDYRFATAADLREMLRAPASTSSASSQRWPVSAGRHSRSGPAGFES